MAISFWSSSVPDHPEPLFLQTLVPPPGAFRILMLQPLFLNTNAMAMRRNWSIPFNAPPPPRMDCFCLNYFLTWLLTKLTKSEMSLRDRNPPLVLYMHGPIRACNRDVRRAAHAAHVAQKMRWQFRNWEDPHILSATGAPYPTRNLRFWAALGSLAVIRISTQSAD